MRIKVFIILVFLILLPISFSSAYEDLDELESRTSRKGINTFYSGESAGNSYIWQPQQVIYKDTTTDREITVLTQTDNASAFTANEYGCQPWSANGKRIAFLIDKNTAAYTRSGDSFDNIWMVAKSDGTYLRPMVNVSMRTGVRARYRDWSPVEPDIFYAFGYNHDGVTGLDQNMLYKHTVSDTSIERETHLDYISGNTGTLLASVKDNITSDGKYMVGMIPLESEPLYVGQITGTPSFLLSYNMPTLDTYWNDTPGSWGDLHDEMLVGNSAEGYWFYFLYTTGSWWRMHLWGTDSNAPNHTVDTSSPYDWWGGTDAQKEVQPVNGSTGTNAFTCNYWSHGTAGRWGSHFVYSDTQGAYVAPGIVNVETDTRTAFPPSGDSGAQYHAWTGWTDYATGTSGNGGATLDWIYIQKIDAGSSGTVYVADSHHFSTTSESPKIGQSPDGTKVAYRTDFLVPAGARGGYPTNADIHIGVTYFPYPPEITSCSATGGTITTQFDWRHDQASPRTYTTRGWPDQDVDDPCPPRETEKFRLWRSTDKSTWTPISTINANIFNRYDFADGTWKGSSFWEITDSPGNGTFYYAVTSIEWSGIESRTLSNIYSITVSGGSGTGSQDTSYPSSPGDLDNISTSDFYTSFNNSHPELIRYYNIYAEDGSTPSVSQRNRIASISANHCSDESCSWVDWLGNTSGNTKYAVTTVDTQGNESDSSYVTNVSNSHRKSPATAYGQYTIEWDAMVAGNGGGGENGIAPPTGVVLTPE